MTDPGSDEQFAQLADVSEIGREARADRARRLLEEWRLRHYPPENDPGADHPDPDKTPSGTGPDYDPLPPSG